MAQIRAKFSQPIVNSAAYSKHPEKRRDTMAFCFKLIDGSDTVVFSRYNGQITSGVGAEVNYALNCRKNVFELASGNFATVTEPVKHLSLDETLERYYGKEFVRRLRMQN